MMILTLDGAPQTFIPLKQFRAAHGLPESFTLAAFEPKDDPATLASIDGHAESLDFVRTVTLASIPLIVVNFSILSAITELVAGFRRGLESVNRVIHLKEQEIDFAVNQTDDLLRTWAFIALRADSPPDFDAVYGRWLDNTVRIATNVYTVSTSAESLACQIVLTAYGRVGMRVTQGDQVAYVADRVHVCPAEGFMASLLREVVGRLAAKLFG